MPETYARVRNIAIALGALAAAWALAPAVEAQEEQTFTLDLQTAYPSTLGLLGGTMSEFADTVRLLSNDTIQIRVHPPGGITPVLEMIDSVSRGSLDMAFGGSSWWGDKEKAFDFFTAAPFGPDAEEFIAWLFEGGGIEINDELYGQFGVKALFCHILPPEGGGWYNRPIDSIEDFRGLRLRWAGLGADILSKVGASPQLVAPADIQPALERGVLDGAEFSVPSLDLNFGLQNVAEYVYYPGFHQQHGFNQVLINLDTWNAFSDRQRRIIEMTCNDMITRSLAESAAAQPPALSEFERLGVDVRRFNDDVLSELHDAWMEVVDEYSARDPNFKRTWESLNSFRESFRRWKEVGYFN